MHQAHATPCERSASDVRHEDTADDDRLRNALPSTQLLQGQSCIAIDHHGTRYVLRATRSGKLILTK